MNALIIEDEKLVALELAASIAEVDPEITVVGTVTSVKTALRWFSENDQPDLIFADVQLSDGGSFLIFEQVKLNCPIIFTTAYNRYAIQAFKVNSIDYLLKPVDWEELKQAINKARRVIEAKSKATMDVHKLVEDIKRPSIYKDYFLVDKYTSSTSVSTTDIAYFGKDNVTFLVTTTGERYPVLYKSLDEIDELLNPALFFRINRNYIINITAVQSLRLLPNDGLGLRLKSPNQQNEFQISSEKSLLFRQWIDK